MTIFHGGDDVVIFNSNPLMSSSSSSGGTTAVEFELSDWTSSGSQYTMTIPSSIHKLQNGEFVATVFHFLNGKYVTNTWAAKTTDVSMDSSGNMILESSDAFAGRIVFSG